jgi:hypothetical protein
MARAMPTVMANFEKAAVKKRVPFKQVDPRFYHPKMKTGRCSDRKVCLGVLEFGRKNCFCRFKLWINRQF